MLKRCLSPLTLVNQLALIVLLSTALGVTGMAISGWLVQGVQGNAHAINEAGSLRMQSYRLLASVPLTQDDQPLIDEMERTAFSPELENAAIRAGQQSQLKALQGYWHTQLDPGLKQAQSPETVAQDVAGFVSRIDALVSSFDQTTELRIDRVVMVHRAMALFMGLLLIFTILLSVFFDAMGVSVGLAREAGTTVRNLRAYQDRGLLPPPAQKWPHWPRRRRAT